MVTNLHKQLEEQNQAIEDLNKLIQRREDSEEDVYSKEEKEVM